MMMLNMVIYSINLKFHTIDLAKHGLVTKMFAYEDKASTLVKS